VYYLYGPFPLYVNALLYKIFGVHLNILYAAGIFFSSLMLLLVFQLGKRFMGTPEATMATLAVAGLCVFKHGGQTIFPYTFAALYGTLLGTAALYLQIRYTENQKSAALLLSGILGGLAFISKMEFGFAILITTVAFLFSSPKERRLRIAMLSLLPVLLIPAFTYGVLAFKMPLNMIIKDGFLLPQYLPSELLYYNRMKSGLNDIAKTMTEMAGASMILASLAGWIGLISLYLARTNGQDDQNVPRRWFAWLYCLSAGGSVFLTMIILILRTAVYISPLRALPLLCALLIYRFLEKDPDQKRQAGPRAIFLLSVYSLAVLGRLITRVPSGGAYGSCLLPVPILLFTYSVTVAFPRLFSRFSKAEYYARLCVLILFSLTVTATLFGYANRYRKEPRFTVQTERGTLKVPATNGPAVDAALRFIFQNTKPKEYILTFPEGSSLNFLTGRPFPLRYDVLTPGFLNVQAERYAIRQIFEKKVPYIFLLNRPTTEFGATAFGRDYFRELWGWIEENYELAVVFGNDVRTDSQIGDKNFFIKCYRLKTRLP
jgi:4-amino-4-deoxy-L-arabinose transferase-like glycosyltransferase